MAHYKESSEAAARNQDIEPYFVTDIYGTETTEKDDPNKLSKISGRDIEIKPGSPHPAKAKSEPGTSGLLYARHQRKPQLREEIEGDFNSKLYNACLAGELTTVKDILEEHYSTLTLDEHGQTPLFAACIGNQPHIVKYLINHGYDVNHQDKDGKTPLHVAIEWDEIEIAGLLVTQFKASLKRRDRRQWTPIHSAIDRGFYQFSSYLNEFFRQDMQTEVSWVHLHAACHSGDMFKVKRLLDTGTDVNHPSSLGFTPLHVACQRNTSEVVKYLLEHGAYKTIHHVCAKGFRPMHLASAKASTEIIKLLLKYRADPNATCDKNQTPLHIATASNKYATVEFLISYSENLNALDSDGNTCLHRAIWNRNLDIITLLLQQNIDVNCLNNRCISPLHAAIAKNERQIVEKLLAAGADPNVTDADGENSLLLAMHQQHESLVEMLLTAGAEVQLSNSDDSTCLHLAIHRDFSTQTINTLIKHGAPLDTINKWGETALLLACVKEKTSVISLLLKSHADPNIPDKHGHCCLHWAMGDTGSIDILQALLERGAHMEARDIKGRTPFLIACQHGKLEKIKVLLHAGTNPSATDADGDSALHNAIYGKCDSKLVKALIGYDIEVNAVNNKLKTALALACITKQTNSIKVLLEAGADANIADRHGNTCIHNAVYHKCGTDTLQLLAKHGADVNVVNKSSETALLLACRKNIDAVITLLDLGADPSFADKEGETILHWAAHKGCSKDFIQQLIDHSVFVDAMDHKCRTALMLACTRQDLPTLDVLLDAGADANIADKDGDTVLHRTIYQHAAVETLQKIIDHVAHLDAENYEGMTALRLACRSEQTESARVLLNSGANPNLTDKDGDNCLHEAVHKGNLQLVKILVSQEININAQNHKQHTALFLACTASKQDIAKVLMSKAADVNMANYRQNAPLHLAVKHDNLAIIADLLEHGANLNVKGQNGMSPLHVAVERASQDCIKMLLKHKPDLNVLDSDGESPLHVACRRGFHDKAALLLRLGADTRCTDYQNRCAFDHAVTQCDKAMLDIFVKHDPSILNTNLETKETALYYYCRKGNADMVEWLLRHGVDKDKTCNYASPLDVALDNGHKKIVFSLIDAGANVSTAPSALKLNFVDKIYRQRHLHMNVLEHMIQSEKCTLDLTTVNEDHETLLMQACKDEAIDVVEMLVDTRENIGINVCDKSGKSAVQVVCANLAKADNESVTLLSMLLRSRQTADLSKADDKGMTALHFVCKNDNRMMSNMLLRTCQTLIHLTDTMGKTPLHYARSPEMVKQLVKFGADTNKRDCFGQTPLLASCQQGNRDVVSTLLSIQPDSSNSHDHMGRTVLHHCTISNTLNVLKGVDNLQVNSVDIHKQTALHNAAMIGDEGSTQQLLEMGANPNLLDKNQLSPLHVASTFKCYELLTQHKANSNLVSRLGCSPADMRQWHQQLQEKDSEMLWQNIIEERHTALLKIISMPLLGFIERNQDHHTEFIEFFGELKRFMMKLGQEMKKVDPLMEAEVIPHENAQEGTVVGTPDRLTFVFLLTKVASLLQPPKEPAYFSANVTLKLRPDLRGSSPDFADDGGLVMTSLLLHRFHSTVQQALAAPDMWTHFPQLYSITKPQADNTVSLIFHGKVFKWFPVTVLLVPGVHFPSWRPSWCNQRCIPEETACYLLARNILHAPLQKQPYLFQLDFLDAEEKRIQNCATQLKDGLKLAKLMRQPTICPPLKTMDGKLEHPASTFISEQMLKTVALHLSEEHTKAPEKFSIPDDCEPLIKFAQLIYEKLAHALEKASLLSYFVPNHDQLRDHFRNLQNPEFSSRQLAKSYCKKIETLLVKHPTL